MKVKNMPYNKNARRISALERLEKLPKHTDPEKQKSRERAAETLKKRIMNPSEALGIRTKKDRRANAKIGRN